MGILSKLASWMSSKDELVPFITPQRNEPCWCGSGIKYKKCHLIEDEKKKAEEKLRLIHCGPT